MSEAPADVATNDPSLWRGPLICLGLLVLSAVLLAFTGSSALLLAPVIIGAWSIVNLRKTKWYWVPLVPCLLAVLFWLYVFVTVLIGYLSS